MWQQVSQLREIRVKLSAKYFDPETLAKIQPLSLRSKYLLEGYIAGLHRSPQRGQSIEFAEHREYSPGDDVRQIDWKVFARTDKYYLKQYEDETNLIVIFVVDTSESMTFRSAKSPLSKLEYAQLIALSLAYLVLDQHDAVSLVTYSSKIDRWLDPSNQAQRWQDMVSTLETAPVGGSTDTGHVLGDLAGRLSRRCLVIVLSDFLDELDQLVLGCRHLRHQRHDVCLLQVLDQAEQSFPYPSPSKFIGLEGQGDLIVDPVSIRSDYIAEFEQHQTTLQAFCNQSEIDRQVFVTTNPISVSLPFFLARRQKAYHQRGRNHA
jgi:uncharacterized protein (DUF58 family)